MTHDPDQTADEDADREADAGEERDDGEFDTAEAELVAYLDGELDDADARRVEAKLSQDPQARERVAALKKTYDLLDYLPRPEPSPTFASRTLDRIPTASGSAPQPAANGAAAHRMSTGALPLSPVSGFAPIPPPTPLRSWFIGGTVAVGLALVLGYFGHAAMRALYPTTDSSNLSLEEGRLVENLPLYSGVDDFDFLVRLADSDEFAPEADLPTSPGVVAPPALAQAAAPQPWGKDPALVQAFKSLSSARQEQLRELDKKLYSQPSAEFARLFQVLESYAAWLHRLEPSERDAILKAESPALRLAKIRKIREHLWEKSLPAGQRELLERTHDDQKRADLIQQWKNEEQDRRRNWLLARKNWETIKAGRIPWPFDDGKMRQEVSDYVRNVLKVDGTSPGRLTPGEAAMLLDAHEFAKKNDAWLWYGSDLYHLSQKYPMLPEPIGTPFTRIEDQFKFLRKLTDRRNLNGLQGKWPDFALAVADEASRVKMALPFNLGPSKPGEFRPPMEAFLAKTLFPVLTPAEREDLKKLEGKWPEYPRRMIEFAKKHDLPVPGVTLPGSPKKWDATYQPPPPKLPKPGN